MISFASRTLQSYVDAIAKRADKFSLICDADDAADCVLASIRRLDQVVNTPRIMVLNNPSRSTELPESAGVDEIVHVSFSNEQLDMWVKEFGFLPLVSKFFPIGSLEAATEFLILKGNINMLSRHLKFAPDWEYYPPYFIINSAYRHVVIEYLPHIDEAATNVDTVDDEEDAEVAWILDSKENAFMVERSWALFMQRNAEALTSAQYVGVGTEYSSVLQYWSDKLEKIDADYVAGGVLTYLG